MTAFETLIRRTERLQTSLSGGERPSEAQLEVLDSILTSMKEFEANLVVTLEANRRVEESQRSRIDLLERQLTAARETPPIHEAFADELGRFVEALSGMVDDDGQLAFERVRDYLSRRSEEYRADPIRAFLERMQQPG